MEVSVIEKKQKPINLKMDLFCKHFATNPEMLGNGVMVYMKVYGIKNYDSAKVSAMRLLDDDRITKRINEYLSNEGFNDANVDRNHLFLINQKKDMNVSMKGIQEYNKLKKRTTDRLELVMPTPLLGWDDDVDTIRKIDKSKAVDVGIENKVDNKIM